MKLDRFIKAIQRNPTEVIEGIICSLTIYVGLFALTPWYQYTSQSVAPTVITSDPALLVYALWLLWWGTFGLFSLIKMDWPARQHCRRITSLAMFVTLLWFVFMRLTVFGWHEVVWVPTLALALIEAILYIRIGWERPGKDRRA